MLQGWSPLHRSFRLLQLSHARTTRRRFSGGTAGRGIVVTLLHRHDNVLKLLLDSDYPL